jgi:peptidyl-prolyl cis-trans isomerase C
MVLASFVVSSSFGVGSALGQTPSPGEEPAKAEAKDPAATGEVAAEDPAGAETAVAKETTSGDKVAVTVNGHSIMEGDVNSLFATVAAREMRGRPMPPDQMESARARLRPRLLEKLIGDELLREDAARAEITVTPKELSTELDEILSQHLTRTGQTRADFEQMIESREGVGLDEFLAQRVADPEFKRSVLQKRLIEKRYPDDLKVSADEIKAQYEQDRQRVYEKPATVRASHILIRTDESATEEQKAEARAKAEAVLVEVKAPEADFAALAGKHSECPSSAQGGDLGFFPRQGAMVEPFAAAAFALDVGQISDIVETRFGYHIIKVTEKKEPTVVTLEEATDQIREQLRAQKMQDLRMDHIAKLKEAAEIVYP